MHECCEVFQNLGGNRLVPGGRFIDLRRGMIH